MEILAESKHLGHNLSLESLELTAMRMDFTLNFPGEGGSLAKPCGQLMKRSAEGQSLSHKEEKSSRIFISRTRGIDFTIGMLSMMPV